MSLNNLKFKLEHPFVVFLITSVAFHLLLLVLPYSNKKIQEDIITVDLVFDEPEIIIPVEETVSVQTNTTVQNAPPVKKKVPNIPKKTKTPGIPAANPKLSLKDVLGNPSTKSAKLNDGTVISSPSQSDEAAITPDIKAKKPASPLDNMDPPSSADTSSLGTSGTKLKDSNVVDNTKILGKTTTESESGYSVKGSGGNLNKISFVTGLNGRKIVFKPRPPEINIQNTTTVQFLIQILPSGDVSRVTPYKKGNPRLEQEGIKYIRQFKFEPIFSETLQQGIIELSVIRGKLQGK